MRPIQFLCIFLVTLAVSATAFAQSPPGDPRQIRADAHLKSKSTGAFPFDETHTAELKWKQGKGGSYFVSIVKDHEHDFHCDYSCSLFMELPADAFQYVGTEQGGDTPDSVHHIYEAVVPAYVIQSGVIYNPHGCGTESEYETDVTLTILEFEHEDWVDLMFTGGEINWDQGDCFGFPASAEIKR